MRHPDLPSRPFQFKNLLLAVAACLALPVFGAADEPGLRMSFPDFGPVSLQPPRPSAGDDALSVLELQPLPSLPGAIDLTAPTDDLWVRLRNGFSMPNLNNDLVLHHQQWYQNRPEYLRRMVERSRRYMHHIVEELEKRGMPTELALLPMVESAFNPMALSRAQAAGLWQFIPSTGKTYRLEQDWWQDQRRDIVASTSAALDYLQTIYEMQGDWHLALASYNWGEGAVRRAIQKNEAKGLPTDYSSLAMPNETRNYVPKLQALKNIFGSARLMAELKIPVLDNRPYFATIESSRPIDVKTAAKLAAMPVDEFVALNPSHNRPVIKADSSLVIPADKVETFQANLENHDEPLASWQAYTLKPGERLDKVAPRFGISLSDLKRINGLNGRLKIAAGSTLLVPAGNGEANLDDFPAPTPPRLPEISARRAPQKGGGQRLARGGKAGKVATVAAGKLTRKDGRSAARLATGKTATKTAGTKAAGGAGKRVAGKSGGEKKKAIAAKPARVSAKVVKAESYGNA